MGSDAPPAHRRRPRHGRPSSYAVGLTARIAPEFVITGLPPGIAQHLLNDMAERVFHGAVPVAHGTRVSDLIAGFDAIIVDGTATEQVVAGVAVACYGVEQVRLQQIVWPDPHGRLPWDTDYSFTADTQPLIGQPGADRPG
jgi:hypothetical protein